MAKLKLTKTAQKAQMDDLKRFNRFLPTLQLKKQQLQMELRHSQALLDENTAAFQRLRTHLRQWTALLGDAGIVDLICSHVKIDTIDTAENNIAGVTVPVFNKVVFELKTPDLFSTDYYVPGAIAAVCELVSLVEAGKVLQVQYELLYKELRTTTQRVNLFEKVKIPECKENIRKIAIYLGDQDTSAVARSKIAKNKSQQQEAEDAASGKGQVVA